jgi:outer membrane PBP1 activator LpoA protein
MKRSLFLTAIILGAFLSGCTVMAPEYSPSVQTVQAIKNSNALPINVSKASAAKPELNKVSLRGNPLKSPYGDYSGYIEHAIKKELEDAGLLDEKSNITVGIRLTKNTINVAMSEGSGELAAVFSVTKDKAKVFEKEISATRQWESSFVGAIAIPNAMNAYPELVSTLIANLFADTEFVAAISK